MSVLIKGMETPPNCSRCPMLEGDRMDGLCHAASRWLDDDEFWTWYVYPEGDVDNSKPCNCPLVPVPPHGDLVDRQRMAETNEQHYKIYEGEPNADYARHVVLRMLDQAPIVIPAEEGK